MTPLQTSFWQKGRQTLFGISEEEVTFTHRGFHPTTPDLQHHLEQVGATFLRGYHAAIKSDHPEVLIPTLNTVDAEWRGFAYEGAAMALALLDTLIPWKRNRIETFLAGAGADHIYMAHVGVGWVPAHMKLPIEPTLKKLDPLLRWLAADGYGFHEGFFHWPRYVRQQAIPRHLSGYALEAFDQGLGRSLWFVEGADVSRIPETIRAFPNHRQADLWSGVGLACAYAAGVDRVAIKALKAAAGLYSSHLAQGAAFAAKARQRANNPTPHTEMACQILCGLSVAAAAKLTDRALENLPTQATEPAYEIWRLRIQSHLSMEKVAA